MSDKALPVNQFVQIGSELIVNAPAKINLTLLIAGKRADGFHDIETIMAKIDLCDKLRFELSETSGIELECTGSQWAPSGRENIVWRACEMIAEYTGFSGGVKITLEKNIPAGGGLGGASSDAAAVLLGMRRLCNANISDDILWDLASQLGSDVPFFLGGPLGYCTGRGEKIQKIQDSFTFRAILLFPGVNVSTKRVYENYVHDEALYRQFHEKINMCISKKNIALVAKICANMLEKSCFDSYKALVSIKKTADQVLGFSLCLSGSGSSLYAIVNDIAEVQLEDYRQRLVEFTGCECEIVNSNRW